MFLVRMNSVYKCTSQNLARIVFKYSIWAKLPHRAKAAPFYDISLVSNTLAMQYVLDLPCNNYGFEY